MLLLSVCVLAAVVLCAFLVGSNIHEYLVKKGLG